MAESSGEKTEEPTPERLRKARDQGNISKSQDFVSALTFVGAFAALGATVDLIARRMANFVTETLSAIHKPDLHIIMLKILDQALFDWLVVSAPVLGATLVLGLAGNYFQVGFIFTAEKMKPKIDKLNPVNGIKQMFSMKRLVEVLKQVVKFTLVSVIVYYAIKSALRNVIMMQRLDLIASIGIIGGILKDICVRVAALFMVVAGADFFWQKHVYRKSLMMTKSEVKREYKQSEGDPEIKQERRRMAQEMVMHGSQQNVKSADAVVTNPAHIAVAIKYDNKSHAAPVVVSKGLRRNAETIKKLARKHDIPILRNVPLAQALNKLELDEEVPEELYEAIAEVLNFVYELKQKNSKRR